MARRKKTETPREDAPAMPDKSAGAPGRGLPPLPSMLASPLGVEGWASRESVLLAALASGEPLLLIGPHGSAKSFLLERLAKALNLSYRFYNASLLNYDDLVGIPVPAKGRKRLEYISTPSAIWDAEVVFFDEVNRTKPELQNKLFPIIHERRVQGIDLDQLQYRWAAMNPAPGAQDDTEIEDYLGAEPLDPALADRFSFLIDVPGWKDLSKDVRKAIMRDQYKEASDFSVALAELVNVTRGRFEAMKVRPMAALEDYLLTLLEYLAQKGINVSTRRASTIHRNILAVHAARQTLYSAAFPDLNPWLVDWAASAIAALKHSLPHIALGAKVDPVHLLAAHRQAWSLTNLDKNDPMRILLGIEDPADRALKAFELRDRIGTGQLCDFVIEAIANTDDTNRRAATALAFYLGLRDRDEVPVHILETLALPLERWFNFDAACVNVSDRDLEAIDRAIADVSTDVEPVAGQARKLACVLNWLYRPRDAEAAARHFMRLWVSLGLDEACASEFFVAA